MPAIPLESLSEAINTARPDLLAFERRKSRLLRLWIVSGIFFMVLPGTILGFTNLLLISAHHGFQGLSPAWIQAHGHAQVFGWIGSFVIGIGFYSQPRTRANSGRLPIVCWVLWMLGLSLRWLAAAYLWHWRITLPLAGALELAAIVMFLYAASQHKLPQDATQSAAPRRSRIEPWMQVVLVSNVAMFAAIAINFVIGIQVALAGTTPARPHSFDPKFLVLLGWGFLAPLIWGFSARWLPIFLGVGPVRGRLLQLAVAIDVVGVALGFTSHTRLTTPVLAVAAILAAIAIRVFSPSQRPPKTIGIHPSFPVFLRIAYAWSILAACIGIVAAFADVHNGIWGGSRHALTVGFAAMMVMTVGPRILPHFAGVRGIYSPRLMFVTLLLLLTGCTLRVSMEPLAYEGIAHFAWKVLPISGYLELSAVLLFALQLILTFTRMPSVFAEPPHASAQV
ncbi:MAG TPA: NnrS family protein [Acidobacteriaceae bacterium]|nr:NnrS family protein [Acidobacteriaceae bacterium]